MVHPHRKLIISVVLAVQIALAFWGCYPKRVGPVGPDGERLTWASVGLFRAAMFAGIAPGTKLPLRPLLDQALAQRRLGARRWHGRWVDVGTAERLAQANR